MTAVEPADGLGPYSAREGWDLSWLDAPLDASRVRLDEQRARVAGRVCLPPIPPKFTTAVVGVTFAAEYPANLAALERLVYSRLWVDGIMEPVPAGLIRRPDNEVDPNAIEVHVSCLGDVGHIGHVPANLARRFAPHLDAGEAWLASIVQVRKVGWNPDQPGIDIEVTRAA